MGILHRVYARHAPEVWETETRLLHALRLVRRPVAVQWVVTAACDLHCPHCYSKAGKRAASELTTDEAKRLLIDELLALGKPMLVLAGGELLLRKDIPELIEYACGRGLSWAMHTHGLHVPKFKELFARHPPALAAISLDGDRELHDLFRGRAGSFDGAIAAMRLLKDLGCPEIVAGTTVTRHNADRVAELFPLVQASAADSWGLHLFAPEGRGAEHMELMPTPEQLRRVAEFARRARGFFHVELCNEWGSAGADDTAYRDEPFLCGAGRISFVVSAQGEVLPCTTTDLSETQGNVRDVPLRDLWRRGFKSFRSAGHGACSDGHECWLQSRNGVHCSQDAFGPVAAQRLAVPPVDLLGSLAGPGDARLLSERGARLARATAVAAVFLSACASRIKHTAEGQPDGSASASPPAASASAGAPPGPGASAGWTPRTSPEPTPTLSPGQLGQHLSAMQSESVWKLLMAQLLGRGEPDWKRARELATQVGASRGRVGPLGEALGRHVEQREKGEPVPPSGLLALLDLVEQQSIFDAAAVAYLWQQARLLPGGAAPVDLTAQRVLMARLGRHLRLAEALRVAQQEGGPIEFQAWRSKAAPPTGWTASAVVTPAFQQAFERAYAAATGEAWTRAGELSLTVVRGQPELVRAGAIQPVGSTLSLRRLDLLRAPQDLALSHPLLGEFTVKSGSTVTLTGLWQLLPADAQERLSGWIAAASRGDQDAMRKVDALAGVLSVPLREFVRGNPQAPRRTALDMTVMRVDE